MALKFVIMILVVVKSAHSAIDAGVTVFGTTEAPNFKRPEGRRKFRFDTHPYERECDFLSTVQLFSATISCPSSHPFACERGEKCTSDMFKPNNAQPGRCQLPTSEIQ